MPFPNKGSNQLVIYCCYTLFVSTLHNNLAFARLISVGLLVIMCLFFLQKQNQKTKKNSMWDNKDFCGKIRIAKKRQLLRMKPFRCATYLTCTHMRVYAHTRACAHWLNPTVPNRSPSYSVPVEQACQCRWDCSIVNNRLGILANCKKKQLRMYPGTCFSVCAQCWTAINTLKLSYYADSTAAATYNNHL